MPDLPSDPEPGRADQARALRIRPFDPAAAGDRDAVLEICLKTGDAGTDATASYPDPRELTDRYATPYLELEPAWAWVATLGDDDDGGDDGDNDGGSVVGYLLGAPDTTVFAARFAAWPSSLTEADRAEHAAQLLMPERAAYPAHLHVDILPAAQGRGVGRMLMQAFIDQLQTAGVPGVHLVVDPANTGALAFYPRLGFTELHRTPDGVLFARKL